MFRAWGVFGAAMLSGYSAMAQGPVAFPPEQSAQQPAGAVASPPAVPSAAPAPAPVSAPDVVVLKNGDRLRGTIAELAHDHPVTIVLVSGQTRTIDWGEVSYAGPADREPVTQSAEPAPAPVVVSVAPPGQQHVRLLSNERRVDFFYRASGAKDGFHRLCTTPCARDLPNGTYQFGIQPADGDEVIPLRTVLVDVPTTLTGEMERRSGARGVGALILTLSFVGACVATYVVKTADHPGLGLPVLVYTPPIIGGVVGLGLVLTSDGASLAVAQKP
ncbi:MAG TPA: hypothetical protein VHB79_00645 [Polyangiaceae bacterium]|nr:hypothetical protein [Polyangiaceae bacterium]